jgi:hypothetical protein
MAGIPRSAVTALQKGLHFVCKYASIAFYWKLKFLKTRVQRWKQCGAQKHLSKAQSGLGAEIYALFKQGETDWEKMPLVRECLKIVEEAESQVFKLEAAIDEINAAYSAKVESIKTKCTCQCEAGADAATEEEPR